MQSILAACLTLLVVAPAGASVDVDQWLLPRPAEIVIADGSIIAPASLTWTAAPDVGADGLPAVLADLGVCVVSADNLDQALITGSSGVVTRDQGYSIRIDDRIQVIADSPAGFQAAWQTLAQLLRFGRHHGGLPRLEISDWPAVPQRALSFCCPAQALSVALRSQLEALLPLLEELKVTGLNLAGPGAPALQSALLRSATGNLQIAVQSDCPQAGAIPALPLLEMAWQADQLWRGADAAVLDASFADRWARAGLGCDNDAAGRLFTLFHSRLPELLHPISPPGSMPTDWLVTVLLESDDPLRAWRESSQLPQQVDRQNIMNAVRDARSALLELLTASHRDAMFLQGNTDLLLDLHVGLVDRISASQQVYETVLAASQQLQRGLTSAAQDSIRRAVGLLYLESERTAGWMGRAGNAVLEGRLPAECWLAARQQHQSLLNLARRLEHDAQAVWDGRRGTLADLEDYGLGADNLDDPLTLSMPDLPVLQIGQTRRLEVMVSNASRQPWPLARGYQLAAQGDTGRFLLQPTTSMPIVPPQATVQVPVFARAPREAGQYPLMLSVVDPEGVPCGMVLSVTLTVAMEGDPHGVHKGGKRPGTESGQQ